MIDRAFWRGRRVLLTGHTGFKGAWLALWLEQLGAKVHGLALAPDTDPSLYTLLKLPMPSRVGDIRNADVVTETVRETQPEIVLHLAAQSLVRRSYGTPVETFDANIMGTAHLLDALRSVDGVQAILVITTDKVYRNDDLRHAFREDDPLGASDPYSASKAAVELVTASFAVSFFEPKKIPVATARAGNVIGGGDWAEDRLVPDIWRSIRAGEPLRLRHPQATRPWQHVLEPLAGYLLYVEKLASNPGLPRALNFGPLADDTLTVADTADAMLAAMGAPHTWVQAEGQHPKEAHHLALDPVLAMRTLGWQPRLRAAQAMQWTADWYRALASGGDARALCLDQIARYEALR